MSDAINVLKTESLELLVIKREVIVEELSENHTSLLDKDYILVVHEDTDSVPIVEYKVLIDLETAIIENNSIVQQDTTFESKKF